MKHKWTQVLMSLAAVFGMVTALSFSGGAAESVNLDEKCSLTVIPGNFTGDGSGWLAEQLDNASVVIDLYRVAGVIPGKAGGFGYDGYQFELEAQYAGEEGLQITEHMTNADWRQQSQKAARIALGITTDAEGAVSGTVQTPPVRMEESVKQEIGGLDAGLYLLIARRGGAGDPDVTYGDVAAYTAVSRDSDGTEQIATMANASDCVFSFEPELIALPGKEPYVDAEGNPVSNTANPGPWLYHMEPVLKARAQMRYGSLQIRKELLEFETMAGESIPRPVTFIFEINAVWEDRISGVGGQREYKDVVAIDFTGAGSETAYRPGEELKLPVGAQVTVKEIYSGPGYSPYPDAAEDDTHREAFEKTTVITDTEQIFEVTFTNYYNRRHVDGHGITNHFTYDAEQDRWIWTSVHADGTVGGEGSQGGTEASDSSPQENQQTSADGSEGTP